jgi:MoaA/NifB/PqqE/SkfB family radical SAM enzyme
VALIGRYLYYFQYRLRALFGDRRPLLGGLKLTHNCNLQCMHCPFWKRSGPSLRFEEALAALKTFHEWGVRILVIEGGEPFLWRSGELGLNDLVAEARELFFSVGVTTNGTFPLESDADVIWVSVDGLKETHDRIRGQSFDRLIANIEASPHPRIYAHVTVNSINWKEVPELVEFLAPRVRGVTVQFHYPYEGGDDELFLPFDRRGEVLDGLIAMKRRGLPLGNSVASLRALKDNRWKCHSWMIASADPTGTLTRGCYVKGRGEVSCERCGFSAHTEISLACDGVLGSICAGHRIFTSTRA